MSTIDVDRDTAHQAAQRELDKPIYPKGSLTQRLYEWIHDLLIRVIEKGSSVPGGWFTVSVLFVLLVVAIVVAIRVVRSTIRTQPGDYQLFDTGQLSADQHRAIAERFAAEGNWAAAIRHRLRAVARSLEEARILEPVPGRTANELATDAGASLPHLAPELFEAATAFNDVTYGERPGTPAGYQLIAGLDEHLRSRSTAANRPWPDQPASLNPWAQVR
jgi:mRNA-degrading endonuclease toxin of MazEF toxin-antitoxin module